MKHRCRTIYFNQFFLELIGMILEISRIFTKFDFISKTNHSSSRIHIGVSAADVPRTTEFSSKSMRAGKTHVFSLSRSPFSFPAPQTSGVCSILFLAFLRELGFGAGQKAAVALSTSDDRYLLSFILIDFTLGQIRCMGDGTIIN